MTRDHQTADSAGGHSDEARESGQDIVREDLDGQERRIVEAHETASAKLVHEIIRQRGIDELERPFLALSWSSIGAGFVIGMSLFAMAAFADIMPDAPYLKLLLAIGYSIGFVAVIAGKMQLFTESTITAVLPLATTPSWQNLGRTLRLWAIVFTGNVIGTLLFSLFAHYDLWNLPAISDLIHSQSHEAMTTYMVAPLTKGMPAGFMLAVLVWSMPNLERQELVVIVLITGLMYISGVSHSVVGSAEMWVTVLNGDFSLSTGLFGFLIPSALGNLMGGAVLFALLAHAQVVPEIDHKRSREGRADRQGKRDYGTP